MKWIILPYSESCFEETKYILVKFYKFSCIQEYIKRIAFENAYGSSVIFQPFWYANVPVESPFYAPTLFHEGIDVHAYNERPELNDMNRRKSKRFQLLDTEFKNCTKGFSVIITLL